MNLKHLTDKTLLADTRFLVTRERELLTKVLHHLKEIDRRKLYSDLGYSSMYDFCIRHLGYAEASAHRRIKAARLLEEIPEIEKKIEDLQKEKAEAESEQHVKGATWSKTDLVKYKLKMKNLDIAMAALGNALKSGETSLEKVVINTIDHLESGAEDDEYVPADELYRALETKLKNYGTSAVAILSKLKSMGVNPRDILKIS